VKPPTPEVPVKEMEMKEGMRKVVAETEEDAVNDKDNDNNKMEVDMDLVGVEKEVVLQEADEGGNFVLLLRTI
jgi:hypothetical protein